MSKRVVLALLVLIVAVIVAVVMWPKKEKEAFEARWSPPPVAPGAGTFRGPTGAPFVVGPSGPPPK